MIRLLSQLLVVSLTTDAWVPVRILPLSSTTKISTVVLSAEKPLGLITFDLDDTLYPIDVVMEEANAAFCRSMKRFGYDSVQPQDIVDNFKQIRKENPELFLSHTEIRKLAIRKVMEDISFERKLKAIAEDFSTDVENLSKLVVEPARKWVHQSVSPSIVDAALTAWEMERHHASERHLYDDVIDALREIKTDHPNVLIGAVTDGRANPLLMTFTLSEMFDFCVSWEDDQAGRRNFFKELDSVEGNAELSWIYQAALDKANLIAQANAEIAQINPPPVIGQDSVWIHVGDDLAYDVGGSAQCGAKTIWAKLADKYGQTSRKSFGPSIEKHPDWDTSTQSELGKRVVMNRVALEHVDRTLRFLTRLPSTVDDIMEEVNTAELEEVGAISASDYN